MKMPKRDAAKFIREIRGALVVANPTHFKFIETVLADQIFVIENGHQEIINVEYHFSHILMRIFNSKNVAPNPQSL